MNPMKARIKGRLDSLPDELSALRRLGLQYLDRCCAIDRRLGAAWAYALGRTVSLRHHAVPSRQAGLGQQVQGEDSPRLPAPLGRDERPVCLRSLALWAGAVYACATA